jgi:hypothetical protein
MSILALRKRKVDPKSLGETLNPDGREREK